MFYLLIIILAIVGLYAIRKYYDTQLTNQLEEQNKQLTQQFESWKESWKTKESRRVKEEAYKKSRSVTFGNTIEHFVPFMEGFPVKPQDVRFFGKPIDFIGFSDLHLKTGASIHFIEVKSGESKLNERQRNIKEAISAGRVYWHEYTTNGIWEHEEPTQHLD